MRKYIILLIFGLLILAGMFPCPIYGFLGVPCPTCGITRAWRLFMGGRLREAFLMHPLFLVPAVFLIPRLRRRWAVILVIALFIAVYLIRMLLQFPGQPPMNYNYDSTIGEFFR